MTVELSASLQSASASSAYPVDQEIDKAIPPVKDPEATFAIISEFSKKPTLSLEELTTLKGTLDEAVRLDPTRMMRSAKQFQCSSAAQPLYIECMKAYIEKERFSEASLTFREVIDCYDRIKSQDQNEQFVKPQTALNVAILTQYEIPKVASVANKILPKLTSPETAWITAQKENCPELLYPLRKSADGNSMYMAAKIIIGYGSAKVASVAVAFHFNGIDTFSNPQLVAHTELRSGIVFDSKALERERAFSLYFSKHEQFPKVFESLLVCNSGVIGYSTISELCNGTLHDILTGKIVMTLKEKLTVAKELCLAVKVMHDIGYVHFDIKPLNILIKGKQVKLTDFGYSHSLQLPYPKRYTYGTCLFSSPEMAFESHHFPERIKPKAQDIFALGLTLLYLFAKKPNFLWQNDIAYMTYHGLQTSLLPAEAILKRVELEKKITETVSEETATVENDKTLMAVFGAIMHMMVDEPMRSTAQKALVELERIEKDCK